MEIFKIFIIIISTGSFIFILFQIWFFVENKDYIYEFNEKYKHLEYVITPSMQFVDYSIFDPNDDNIDVNKKMRCVLSSDNHYYSVSDIGFLSTDSIKLGLKWVNIEDCISNTFKSRNLIIYNPCSLNVDEDCNLLKSLMNIK